MRVSLRRPPTILEQLLGRKRAKSLRRRLGVVAVATGVALLKPRVTRAGVALTCAAVLVAIVGLGIVSA
jgi:hypothetical protein